MSRSQPCWYYRSVHTIKVVDRSGPSQSPAVHQRCRPFPPTSLQLCSHSVFCSLATPWSSLFFLAQLFQVILNPTSLPPLSLYQIGSLPISRLLIILSVHHEQISTFGLVADLVREYINWEAIFHYSRELFYLPFMSLMFNIFSQTSSPPRYRILKTLYLPSMVYCPSYLKLRVWILPVLVA